MPDNDRRPAKHLLRGGLVLAGRRRCDRTRVRGRPDRVDRHRSTSRCAGTRRRRDRGARGCARDTRVVRGRARAPGADGPQRTRRRPRASAITRHSICWQHTPRAMTTRWCSPTGGTTPRGPTNDSPPSTSTVTSGTRSDTSAASMPIRRSSRPRCSSAGKPLPAPYDQPRPPDSSVCTSSERRTSRNRRTSRRSTSYA